MEFVVYILASDRTDKLYKGQTSNLIARMKSHNELGSGWTARYRPWEVVHLEFFATKSEAMQREKWFKTTTGRRWLSLNIN
jgi:putative endonuclease